MCPKLSTGYSITTGMSGERDNVTVGPKAVAFVNKVKYRKAKFNSTGSCISMWTASSSLSTAVFFFNKIFPVPKSPLAENRIPSLVTAIVPIQRIIYLITSR